MVKEDISAVYESAARVVLDLVLSLLIVLPETPWRRYGRSPWLDLRGFLGFVKGVIGLGPTTVSVGLLIYNEERPRGAIGNKALISLMKSDGAAGPPS